MREAQLRTADQALLAVLATMAALILLGLAWGVAYETDHSSSWANTLPRYLDRMQELAGAGAIDCGLVPLDADPEPAVSCVESALREGRPFRVAIERHGEEGRPFRTGITRIRNGVQYPVSYYVGVHDLPESRVNVWPCPKAVARADSRWSMLRCY